MRFQFAKKLGKQRGSAGIVNGDASAAEHTGLQSIITVEENANIELPTKRRSIIDILRRKSSGHTTSSPPLSVVCVSKKMDGWAVTLEGTVAGTPKQWTVIRSNSQFDSLENVLQEEGISMRPLETTGRSTVVMSWLLELSKLETFLVALKCRGAAFSFFHEKTPCDDKKLSLDDFKLVKVIGRGKCLVLSLHLKPLFTFFF
jgi:hypothetical protein